jgi:hypothetical protein
MQFSSLANLVCKLHSPGVCCIIMAVPVGGTIAPPPAAPTLGPPAVGSTTGALEPARAVGGGVLLTIGVVGGSAADVPAAAT